MSSLIVVLPLPVAATGADGGAVPDAFGGAWNYVATTPDGMGVARHAGVPLALLPPPARGRGAGEVVALVPAAALSWHRVELPRGTLNRQSAGSPRLRAVLDGVLEDRLLDDTARLHFALEPGASSGAPVWVAVCDRGWLRGALQALEGAGRAATRIVPEFAPGPAALHAIGTPDRPLLAMVSERGVALLPLSNTALALAGGGAPLTDDVPALAEPAVAELAEQVLERPPALQTAAERWVEAARSRWDLAQFGLQTSGRGRALRKAGGAAREWLNAPRWRALRWGLALLLGVQLLGLNAWAWREGAALDAKRAAIHQVLKDTFPAVPVIVDAPLQMERELQQLRQSAGAASGRDFEALLSGVGGALAQVAPQAKPPTGIEFAGGELRLKGLSLTSQQVEGIANRLRATGLDARTDAGALLLRPQAAAGAGR